MTFIFPLLYSGWYASLSLSLSLSTSLAWFLSLRNRLYEYPHTHLFYILKKKRNRRQLGVDNSTLLPERRKKKRAANAPTLKKVPGRWRRGPPPLITERERIQCTKGVNLLQRRESSGGKERPRKNRRRRILPHLWARILSGTFLFVWCLFISNMGKQMTYSIKRGNRVVVVVAGAAVCSFNQEET